MEQRSAEWHNLRKTKIGASDAPSIMGVGFRTPLQVWEEKVLGREANRSSAMQFGIYNEGVVRDLYNQKTGYKFEPSVIISRRNPFMMASFDGACGADFIEIKCAGEEDHETAKSGKIPEKYFPQLQHQMEVADVNGMTYLSWHKGDLVKVDVDIDSEYIQLLIAKEKEFWELIMSFTPPAMTAKDKICKDADPEFMARWLRAKEINLKVKELEKILDDEKKALINMADGRSVEGILGKLTKYIEKGRINYEAIPELIGVNLDNFRKDPSERWKITFA